MSFTLQNFYKSTLSLDWSTGTGTFYVTTKPTIATGWLVISPNNSTIREIIKYTSTGTDANGDYVVVATRGVGGTTEQTHTVGEPIRMNITAEYWDAMNDDIAAIVASGVSNANTTTMGGVEEATATEIDAGTQTGGTGAELFINPKLLNDAHNIPLVAPGTSGNIMMSDGTDWTSSSNISKKVYLSTTEVTFTDGNGGNGAGVEKSVFSTTIPANTLSTNNGIKFKCFISAAAVHQAAGAWIIKINLGGTTVLTLTSGTSSNDVVGVNGFLEGYILADGATNAQKVVGSLFMMETEGEADADTVVGASKVQIAGVATSAKDSTASLAFEIAVTMTNNAVNDGVFECLVVEQIK